MTSIILTYVVTILLYTFLDGILAAIRDYRTGHGKPPYKDFYHLIVHLHRFFGSISAILVAWELYWFCSWLTIIALIAYVVFLKLTLWNRIHKEGLYFYKLDEKVKINLGFLNKLLGFHW